MTKPTTYLDTTIIAAYWFEGDDLLIRARREVTRQWWAAERQSFDLYTSSVTEREFRAGKYPHQRECVRMNARIAYLRVTRAVHAAAAIILERGIVPAAKRNDALQLALATIYETDFLLTWNYAHLANPVVQNRLFEFCDEKGLKAPFLVSPESIPWASRGQRIRRK